MRFNEKFNISEKKLQALFKKIEDLNIDLNDIKETFLRGGGKGGQKQNKTSNGVLVRHIPTGLFVTCQRERERNKNRFIAFRTLVDQIEAQLFPKTSVKAKEIKKIRKQKQKRKQRTKNKKSEN